MFFKIVINGAKTNYCKEPGPPSERSTKSIAGPDYYNKGKKKLIKFAFYYVIGQPEQSLGCRIELSVGVVWIELFSLKWVAAAFSC